MEISPDMQLQMYYQIKSLTNRRVPFIGRLVSQILDKARDYDCEDLVHDAFCEILVSPPETELRDWLYNFYRRKLRVIKKRVNTCELTEEITTEDIETHVESDLKETVQNEMIRVLGEDVYCLLGEGRTIKETAEIVGMNYDTLKDRLRRLRKSTAKLLILQKECLNPSE
jgi:DNA-directed RNA polymerase specialized sigma24 family protein